jgi:hypothetical protein
MKICHLQTPGHHKIGIHDVQMVNFIDISELAPDHLLVLNGKKSPSLTSIPNISRPSADFFKYQS